MQTKLTKKVNLRLEPGDLLRFFRVLEYVHDNANITDVIAKSDATLLLDELREIRDIIKSDEAPKNLNVSFDVLAEYERASDNITLGDIFVPGEKLPEVDDLIVSESDSDDDITLTVDEMAYYSDPKNIFGRKPK